MKLNVLTASVSRDAGGLFASVRKLTQAVKTLDIMCQVYAFEDEHTGVDVGAWAPLEVVAYARKGPPFFPVSLPMRRAVIDSHPDIVHCHGIWLYPSIVNLSIQSKQNVPYVISPRGMLDSWATRNSQWKKKLAGWAFENRHLRGAACFHALSQSEAESIRAYGLKNPIARIPNGVDLPEIDRSTFNVQRSTNKRKLLFLGRIHPKKGLKELIEAYSKAHSLTPKVSSWQLLIAGWDDGGHLESLKQQAAELGLWSGARNQESGISSDLRSPISDLYFMGPKYGEEKDRLFREVDAFILPSFSEGLPMSVLEAWSYGLPVLMTDFCNLPEGFRADAAIRIEPDSDSIAQGLLQMVSMAESDLQGMGMRGRKLVEEQFTWDRIAVQMKAVYKWCLGGVKPDCVFDG